jgi:hypothetical protein
MVIVGCGYKKRVGKDTFCELVRKLYPHREIKRLAFADALKNEVYERLLKPLDLEQSILDDPKVKDTIRPLMQGWGSLRREFFHPDYWIQIVFDKIKSDSNNEDSIYIITDCRFPNEINYLKSHGGITINIKRDSVYDPNETHISEIALDSYVDEFDFTINNDGTIEKYEESVKLVMDQVLSNECKL